MEKECSRIRLTKDSTPFYSIIDIDSDEVEELQMKAVRYSRMIKIFDKNKEDIIIAKRISWFKQKWEFLEGEEFIGMINFGSLFSLSSICQDVQPKLVIIGEEFYYSFIKIDKLIFQDSTDEIGFSIKPKEEYWKTGNAWFGDNRYREWMICTYPPLNPLVAILTTMILDLRRKQVSKCCNV